MHASSELNFCNAQRPFQIFISAIFYYDEKHAACQTQFFIVMCLPICHNFYVDLQFSKFNCSISPFVFIFANPLIFLKNCMTSHEINTNKKTIDFIDSFFSNSLALQEFIEEIRQGNEKYFQGITFFILTLDLISTKLLTACCLHSSDRSRVKKQSGKHTAHLLGSSALRTVRGARLHHGSSFCW